MIKSIKPEITLAPKPRLAEQAAVNRARLDAMTAVTKKMDDAKPAHEHVREIQVVPTIFPSFDYQVGVGGLPIGKIVLIHGASANGKALADGTPVLTNQGWKAIEQLVVGDMVIGSDGKPHQVLGVFPQGEKQLYRVEFTGGREVECSGDHLWKTRTTIERRKASNRIGPRPERKRIPTGREGAWTVRALSEIDVADEHEIPMLSGPIEFERLGELPLDPYLLGLLLGDGGFTDPTPTFTKPEPDLIDAVAALLPDNDSVTDKPRNGRLSAVRIVGGETRRRLEKLELYRKRSWEKSIPLLYLRASVSDRLELLRGLMDTDGSVLNDGIGVEFSSTSDKLADDTAELARSLGGVVKDEKRTARYTYKGQSLEGRPSRRLRITFNDGTVPVKSEKHLSRWKGRDGVKIRRTAMTKITPTRVASCTCISVDSPDSLFVTRDYLLTHNSPFGIGLGRSFLERDHFFDFVDAERATDAKWLRTLMGPTYEHPGFTTPAKIGHYEDVRAHARRWADAIGNAREKAPPELKDMTGLMLVDSINRLMPKSLWDELSKATKADDEDGKKKKGRFAKAKTGIDGMGGRAGQIKAAFNAAWLGELVPLCADTRTTVVIIARETREDGDGFMADDIITVNGGRALLYDSSLWLRVVDQMVWAKKGDDAKGELVGFKHAIEIRRSKVGARREKIPEAYYHTSNGATSPEGFDRARDVLELALELGVVELSGAYYSLEGEVLGQGKEKALEHARGDRSVLELMEASCRAKF